MSPPSCSASFAGPEANCGTTKSLGEESAQERDKNQAEASAKTRRRKSIRIQPETQRNPSTEERQKDLTRLGGESESRDIRNVIRVFPRRTYKVRHRGVEPGKLETVPRLPPPSCSISVAKRDTDRGKDDKNRRRLSMDMA